MELQIPNWLEKRAEITPKRTALIFENQSYTFEQIFQLSSKVARQLTMMGIKKGTMTAVLLSNHVDSVVILYALQMLGSKTVILNNRLTLEELKWQIDDSRASYVVTEKDLSFKLKSELIDQQVVEKEVLFLLPEGEVKLQADYDLNEITTIMYTSGTTGKPKGVIQTYGNHWWSATASALNLGLSEEDCWLCSVPIFHISGYSILMRSLIYGMPVVLHKGFDVEKVLEEIHIHRVTIMSVVSTMLLRINEELGEKNLPSSFRCMLLGGGPAPISLLQSCKSKGIPVFQSYGMTETASQFATLSPEYSFTKLGSAGKPLFPNQIKVVDENKQELPRTREGEIIVKGPNVTIGYLHREDATKKAIYDGWLHTGDIGYLDEEGFLYVLDRRADLIISGGENVYPAEIEGALLSHPNVLDAGVIGVKDEIWGQIPIAFIVKRENTPTTEKDFIDYCQQKLAKYKVPKTVYFIKELPRNASKKLLRRELRTWVEKEYRTK
ncbi:o-succinylbenzoate--CoA ligase [Bacillus sp. B15-48]|uniref:o-succinylbenzoate--CoA ligase n=1 Tax=Bacillus sp. B15-48 TaxID=1548601 RepID=UPI00193FC46F|nr:o-succinylbenzoate--CoA ligase [Bacillus sp. B15-48]MBM4762660.1 o-succinylbenzoate--CoA ligase [Bacillus sp. B15-48]